MILGVDIGNTNVVISAIENGKAVFEERIVTDKSKDVEHYSAWAESLDSVKKYSYEGGVLCSVVPPLDSSFVYILTKLTGKCPVVLNYRTAGIELVVDKPQSVGNDLIAAAVGAENYPKPQLIVDMGTATTLTGIDENGKFIGVVITCGAGLELKALKQNTAQLPEVSVSLPNGLFGRNTVDCMKSGAIYGHAAMIDGFVLRMKDIFRIKPTVILTGGISGIVAPLCKSELIVDRDLLMKGMYSVYMRNRGEQNA